MQKYATNTETCYHSIHNKETNKQTLENDKTKRAGHRFTDPQIMKTHVAEQFVMKLFARI